MLNCLTNENELKDKESYPDLAYPVYDVNYSLAMHFYGVFESESDAQQYCLDHSTDSKPISYYTAIFKPPTSSRLGNTNYPYYGYVVTSKRPTDPHYIPQPPYVYANAEDASDLVDKSTKDINYMYSIQNWIAADTYRYEKHGFVGHKFFKHVAPAQIVVPDNSLLMER